MRLLLTISLFLLTLSAFSQRGIFRKVETDIIRMRTMGNADSTLFLTTDSTGHLALKKVGGSASPYHLPYNGDSTYVLAGDSTLHKLPAYTPFDSTSLSNRINQKQNKIKLTTLGQTGASTLINDTLNIPNYFFATNDSTDYSFSSMTAIYSEAGPGEATIGSSGVTANKDNLNFPFKQLKALDVGGWNAGDYVSFSWPTAKNSTSYTFLRGFVRLKQAVPIIQSLSFQFFNSGVAVSQILSMVNYGLDKSKVDVYQNITIPMSAFGFNTNGFDEIRLIFGGGSSASGLYLDLFQFQNATVQENKYLTDAFRSPGTLNVYGILGGQNKLLFTDSIGTPVDTQYLRRDININTTAIAGKENAITASNTAGKYWNGYKQFVSLNTDSVTEATNKYYTDTRARAALTLTTNDDTAATYNNTTGRFNIPKSLKRFGIEDNTSTVDRYMDMQGHEMIIDYANDYYFTTLTGNGLISAASSNFLIRGGKTVVGGEDDLLSLGKAVAYLQANGTTEAQTFFVGEDIVKIVKRDPQNNSNITGSLTFPNIQGAKNVPYSVNGNFADATGNITVTTGGGGSTYTDAQARAAISLTTTGTSGAATYNNATGVLNVPQYATSVGTITWLGTAYNINSGNNITLTTPTTSDISEGSNPYFTNARARAAISVTGSGTYDNTTGVINITGGSSSGWSTSGNTGATNVFGLTSNNSLRMYTNSTQRMVIDSLGFVGIGTTPSTTSRLNLNGSITVANDASSVGLWIGNGGAIRGVGTASNIYIDGNATQGGIINLRATTISLGGAITAAGDITGAGKNANFGNPAAGTGFQVNSNTVLNTNSTGAILRFNDNANFTKVGMRGQNYQINDVATPANLTFNSSALLELSSTTKGVIFPKMTTTQRDAIAGIVEGLTIYNLTTHQNETYNGSTWAH